MVTIGDLKDDYFDGAAITPEQIRALKEFDKYRVEKLRNIENEFDFQKQYFDLQIIENTMDYREFLDNLKT